MKKTLILGAMSVVLSAAAFSPVVIAFTSAGAMASNPVTVQAALPADECVQANDQWTTAYRCGTTVVTAKRVTQNTVVASAALY